MLKCEMTIGRSLSAESSMNTLNADLAVLRSSDRSIQYEAGEGIKIENEKISVKIDNDTLKLDDAGNITVNIPNQQSIQSIIDTLRGSVGSPTKPIYKENGVFKETSKTLIFSDTNIYQNSSFNNYASGVSTSFSNISQSIDTLSGNIQEVGGKADIALDNSNSSAFQEQYIYISKPSGTNSVEPNTKWQTRADDVQNTWTTKRPIYNQDYPVVFVARQTRTVAQQNEGFSDCNCTTPVKDDTTTVIDGGHIITGTIDARSIAVNTIVISDLSGYSDVSSAISTAQSTAETASSTANTANETANTANATANTANETANTANTTANTANRTANTANGRATYQYGTCTTAAATKAKVVKLAYFALFTGAQVSVKFTHTNTAASPTLNVNSSGNRPIYAKGASLTANSQYTWAAGDTVSFVFNGAQWELKDTSVAGNIYTANTTTIAGGKITTGTITATQIAANAITSPKIATDAIKSRNYNSTVVDKHWVTNGTYLNLADGVTRSKYLSWDADGAYVKGEVIATSGKIGNFEIVNSWLESKEQYTNVALNSFGLFSEYHIPNNTYNFTANYLYGSAIIEKTDANGKTVGISGIGPTDENGVNNYALYITGRGYATRGFSGGCDESIKKDIKDVSTLDKLKGIRVKRFKYSQKAIEKKEFFRKKKKEIKDRIPLYERSVYTDDFSEDDPNSPDYIMAMAGEFNQSFGVDNGNEESINYTNAIGVALRAIQELATIVDNQAEQIKTLENKLADKKNSDTEPIADDFKQQEAEGDTETVLEDSKQQQEEHNAING